MAESWRVVLGDCVTVMAGLPAGSVDAIVTDPPYGLGFMGREWDHLPPGEEFAREALRVLKPGGHLLAFGGTRTYHRLVCAVEDAGFEVRDCIAWLYGSGFPKSLDVSKALDAAAGKEREVIGVEGRWNEPSGVVNAGRGAEARTWVERQITAPTTPEAVRWQGWGTALKPAFEPIVVARKPLSGTVAANVLAHGTGALNVDGCRVATDDNLGGGAYAKNATPREQMWGEDAGNSWRRGGAGEFEQPEGRWPANVAFDEDAAATLDEQTGELTSGNGPLNRHADKARNTYGAFQGTDESDPLYGDSGGASRFFYVAKASSAERTAGLNACKCAIIKPCHEQARKVSIPPAEGTQRRRDTTAHTSTGGSGSFTMSSGKNTTDPSQTDTKSTTGTRTSKTTESKTSSSSIPSRTSEHTPPTTESAARDGNASAESAGSGSPRLASTSTPTERDGFSTADADRATSRSSSQPSGSAGKHVCADCGGVIGGAFRNTHPT